MLSLTPSADAVRMLSDVTDAAAGDPPLRGRVEHFSLKNGVLGWLVDRTNPAHCPDVRLACGTLSVPGHAQRTHRHDIWDTDDATLTPGFRVAPQRLIALVAASTNLDEDTPITVQVATTGATLGMHSKPTLGQVRKWAEKAARAPAPVAETASLPLPLALHRLSTKGVKHHGNAAVWRANEAHRLGHVEAIAQIDAHHVLLRGWTRRAVAREQAAVIVCDGVAHPGGLIMVEYPREDLKEDGATAFVAVFQSSWQPALDDGFTHAHLFLTREAEGWLQASKAQTSRTATDLRRLVQDLGRQSQSARLKEIDDLLVQVGPWQMSPQDTGARMAVDHVYLLPGFGALIDGWAVSPCSRVAGVELRVGETVLTGDDTTLQLRARPDLAAPYPQHQDRLGKAGFCIVLRGPLTPTDWSQPMVRLTMSDGNTLVVSLDPGLMRRIDSEFAIDKLAGLYPALDSEPWLGELAAAWRSALVARLSTRWRLLQPLHSPHLLVVALPENNADLTLSLDSLWANVATLPHEVGLCLLFTAGHDRQRVMRWWKALRERAGSRPVGLVELDSVARPRPVLSALLQAAGTRRFTLLGHDMVMLPDGWSLLRQPEHWRRPELVALRVAGLNMGRHSVGLDANAFAWNSEAFAAWEHVTPELFSSRGSGGGLPWVVSGQDEGSLQARRLSHPEADNFSARLDEALLAAAGLSDSPAKEQSS